MYREAFDNFFKSLDEAVSDIGAVLIIPGHGGGHIVFGPPIEFDGRFSHLSDFGDGV